MYLSALIQAVLPVQQSSPQAAPTSYFQAAHAGPNFTWNGGQRASIDPSVGFGSVRQFSPAPSLQTTYLQSPIVQPQVLPMAVPYAIPVAHWRPASSRPNIRSLINMGSDLFIPQGMDSVARAQGLADSAGLYANLEAFEQDWGMPKAMTAQMVKSAAENKVSMLRAQEKTDELRSLVLQLHQAQPQAQAVMPQRPAKFASDDSDSLSL